MPHLSVRNDNPGKEEKPTGNGNPFGFETAEAAASKPSFDGVEATFNNFPILPKEATDFYADCKKECEEKQKVRDDICKNIVARTKLMLKQNGCGGTIVYKKLKRKKCATKKKSCGCR